jgi:ferredoxin
MHFRQQSKSARLALAERGTGRKRPGRNTKEKVLVMADLNSRLPQNTLGPWYVDSNCIDCDLCRETAPTVFKRDEDGGYSMVFHQPETEEEIKQAQEAKEGCPVEAIGDDGLPPGAAGG